MTERIDYARTAQTAREFGLGGRLAPVSEARFYSMSGLDGTGRILYDEARFEQALRAIQHTGTLAGLPGYVGPSA